MDGNKIVIGYQSLDDLANFEKGMDQTTQDMTIPIKVNDSSKAARVLLMSELYGEISTVIELALQNASSEEVLSAVKQSLESTLISSSPIKLTASMRDVIDYLTENPYKSAGDVAEWATDRSDVQRSLAYRQHASATLNKLKDGGVLGSTGNGRIRNYVMLEKEFKIHFKQHNLLMRLLRFLIPR